MATQVSYQFTHEALTAADHVQVVRFEGREGISQLFEFTIELLCSNADLDQDDMLDKDATFSFAMGDDKRVVQGILSEFDAIKQVNNQVLYQAVLVPRLWQLSLYKTNEVYLDMTTPEMIKAVLAEGGLSDIDYDFSRVDEGNTKKYRKWPFKLQYAESHLDFMSRMMERDGIYYFFEATENGEKIIFCDDLNHHSGIENSTIKYLPASSLEINQAANTVSNFIAQRQRLPNKVLLRDYNDNTPSLDIKGEYEVDPRGKGEVYVWGLNIENSDEGLHLAKVSAERLIAKHHTYSGESTVCRLVPGFLATLEGHFRAKCNIEYQVVSIEHQGINPEIVQEATKQQAYENQFIAISSDTQFRAELLTARPEIHGNLNAFVDASGDGHYAEVDKEGRYRITLPFDRVDREGKKASHYIRMSQPFSGENQGMHFPLRKGAEVLLSFIGGDPDRPVISGSIPNASQPSVVNEENQTNSLIKTGAGNKIELEDKDGKNRIKLQTGDDKTYVHLGSPNHAGDGWVVLTKGMERKEIQGGQQITVTTGKLKGKADTEHSDKESAVGKKIEQPQILKEDQGNNSFKYKASKEPTFDEVLKAYWKYTFKGESEKTITVSSNHPFPLTLSLQGKSFTKEPKLYVEGFSGKDIIDESAIFEFPKRTMGGKHDGVLTLEDELSGSIIVHREKGTKYSIRDGEEYNYGGGNFFSWGNSQDIVHWDQADEDEAFEMLTTMQGYNLTGMEKYTGNGNGNPTGNWKEIVSKGEVDLKQTDTFTAQNGNIYDFGGYWNYNLGNSYEENHMKQNGVKINHKEDKDLTDSGGPGYTKIDGKFVKLVNGSEDGKGIWVSKSYGNAYDFNKGECLEVQVGNTESQTYGATYDYYDGTVEEHFRGATHTTNWAATNEMNMSVTNSMTLGVSNEMNIAAANSMVVGAKNEMFVGFASDMSLAKKFELSLGSSTKVEAVIENDITPAKFTKVKTKIEAKQSEIKSAKIQLAKLELDTKKNKAQIKKVKAQIKDCKASINKSKASVNKVVAWFLV